MFKGKSSRLIQYQNNGLQPDLIKSFIVHLYKIKRMFSRNRSSKRFLNTKVVLAWILVDLFFQTGIQWCIVEIHNRHKPLW